MSTYQFLQKKISNKLNQELNKYSFALIARIKGIQQEIAIYQLDVKIVKELNIVERNVLVLNMLNMRKKGM